MSMCEDFDTDEPEDDLTESAQLAYLNMDTGFRHEALRHAVHIAGLSPGADIPAIVSAAKAFYAFLSGDDDDALVAN